MDKQEYQRKLSELAEIKKPKPKTTPGIRLDDTDQNDVRNGEEWILVNKQQNDTLPIELVKTKDIIRSCELGCGEIVTNQVVEKRMCWTPKAHWRTKCVNCGCFVSPDGLGFIEGGHAIQAAYMRYFNGLKQGPTVIEHPTRPDEEIRDYSEGRPSRWTTDANGNIVLRSE